MVKFADKLILLITVTFRIFLFNGSVKANGVILENIVVRLNTNTSLIAWALALQNGLAYITAPVSLFILKKVGNRELCVFGGILSGLGYIFCGFYMDCVWQVFFGFSLSGIGFGLSCLSCFLVLRSYFDNETLSKVIAFVTLFDFVGVAILPPLLQYFVNHYGLAGGVLIYGGFVWNSVLAGVAIRDKSETKEAKDNLNPMEVEGLTVKAPEESPILKCRLFLRETTVEILALFRHNNLLLMLLFETIMFYIFISWALFLFSLGISAGLSGNDSVLLSTFGGIGGCIGRIATFFIFQFNKANPVIVSFVPIFVTGVSLLALAFVGDFTVMATLVVVSGISQGLQGSGIFSTIPTLICYDHYQTVVVLELVMCGVSMQFSGLISGIVVDITGSAVYVYVVNALLSFLMVPFALWWSCHDTPDLNCRWSRKKGDGNIQMKH